VTVNNLICRKENDILQKKFPCFSVTKNKTDAYCTICRSTISVANKGMYDLEQHISSDKHKKYLQAGESSQNVKNFFLPKYSKTEEKVLAIEATLAFHTLNII
jgi:hypothetical protein